MNTAASLQYKSLSDFLTSEQEAEALAAYMQKVAVNNRKPQKNIPQHPRLLFSHKSKSY